MSDPNVFSYTQVTNVRGEVAWRPLLPVTLSHDANMVQANGLLDTGADVNVLPYSLGVALGGEWEQARTGLQLSGNLAQFEARGILLECKIGTLPLAWLAFAWTRAENVPLLFGQINFFAEYDVCFFQARKQFEVKSKIIV